MPKVDIREVLSDRTKYPDDMVLALANGDEISVKDYRDHAMPKGDFTRHAAAAADKERGLQEQLQTAQQNVAREIQMRQELEARQNTPPAQRTAPAGQLTEEDYIADPVLGPMVRRYQAIEQRLEALQKTGFDRIQAIENENLRGMFTGQLAGIAARHNAQFKDDPFDQGKFLDDYQKRPLMRYDQQTGKSMPDLDTFHRHWTHDSDLKSREAAAEQRGIEKGKQVARVPRVPYGRRSAPATGASESQDFRDLSVAEVQQDDELMSSLRNEQG